MHGLLATLRLPVALRDLWTVAAAVPATAGRLHPTEAVVAAAAEPSRAMARPQLAPRVSGTLEAPPTARPSVRVEPTLDATATAPLEPSVPVSAAHLVDPVGLRVVPFRPTSRWPLRRATPRIYDPFRGFPLRSAHLADLIDGRTPEH